MKKVALVTGSARGIGQKTAMLFAENGYNVVFSDVAESVSFPLPEGAVYLRCDISKEEDRKRVFAAVAD